MTPLSPHPLRQLFSGLVEQVFNVEVGICDTGVTGYLTDLLADFVHIDRIYRLRDVNAQTIRDVSRMQAEAMLGPDVDEHERLRIINKYIGDFTLFWTGVYPESLRPRHQEGIDRLGLYLVQGKRSYGIASELSEGDDRPPGDVLAQLSEQFEFCVHGLRLVRANWERVGGN